MAGKLLAWFGWQGVNYAVFPMVVLALVITIAGLDRFKSWSWLGLV